jgi:alpha-methylacyl-CoA racemase
MQLADLGAEVIRVERPGTTLLGATSSNEHTLRGRTCIQADLRSAEGLKTVRDLITGADVLLEGQRPGVMERLGLGPDTCMADNPRLVYVRITGWGHSGPLARTAGHDINYLALTGALHAIGTPDTPIPPLSLLGNYGGGSSYAVTGVLAALLRRSHTDAGAVVDVAIVDGVCNLMQPIWELRAEGEWHDSRASNFLDGAAPFYRTYRCADGRHVAVGAIEPIFFARLVSVLGLDHELISAQADRERWPVLTDAIGAVFATRTRDEWTALFADADACVTPVLSLNEASGNRHLRERGSLVGEPGKAAAGPAPRLGTR